MMETIISWWTSILGELLNGLITGFLGLMDCDLAVIVGYFPALEMAYNMFQAIGIGLILAIAIYQTMKFFTGQISDVKDTPIQIGIRAMIAGIMLYFGGYFLDFTVRLAKIPFDTFIKANANETTLFPFLTLSQDFRSYDWGLDAWAVGLGAGAVLVASFVLILLVGWNCIKLMIEVCERYLMLGVLVYSSPLIFPTITSKATSSIFSKWLGMFFGQCAILTVSAWLMKVIISGFSFTQSDSGIMFRLLLTLAMCKIAQRVDTYMQQLGIGVATTGGNLVDDIIATTSFLGKVGKGKGSSKSAVLGADATGSLSKFGGILGGISNATQKGFQSYKEGASGQEIGRNLGKDFSEGAMGMAGKIFNATKQTPNVKVDDKKNFGSQNTYTSPFDKPDRKVYVNPKGAWSKPMADFSNAEKEIYQKFRSSGQNAEKFAYGQRMENGVGSINFDSENGSSLDETAQSCGLSWDNNSLNAMNEPEVGSLRDDGSVVEYDDVEHCNRITGPFDIVGDFIASNYGNTEHEDFVYALGETAIGSIPEVAEQSLFNPFCELKGNDFVGDGLLKNAFGEKEITGEIGGNFTNIHAYTIGDECDRVIEADYISKDGSTRSYKITNSLDYFNRHNPKSFSEQVLSGIMGDDSMDRIKSKGSERDFFIMKK